jgi:hypothetical protein
MSYNLHSVNAQILHGLTLAVDGVKFTASTPANRNIMTPDQRKQEFDRLFEAIPGKNVERIRRVAEVLYCKENTVRIWRMKRPPRMIPEAKLRILQRAIGA